MKKILKRTIIIETKHKRFNIVIQIKFEWKKNPKWSSRFDRINVLMYVYTTFTRKIKHVAQRNPRNLIKRYKTRTMYCCIYPPFFPRIFYCLKKKKYVLHHQLLFPCQGAGKPPGCKILNPLWLKVIHCVHQWYMQSPPWTRKTKEM